MNDPLVHEQADNLAVRVGLAFDSLAERIDYAYQLVLSRRATSDEVRQAEEYLSQSKARLAAAGTARDEVARERWPATCAYFCRAMSSCLWSST